MMALEELQHWEEGVRGELGWLREELKKDGISAEDTTEYTNRITELEEELKGEHGQ